MYPPISLGLLALSLISAVAASTATAGQGRTAQLVAYYGQTGGQDRLKTFCDDSTIDMFPIGFVNGFTNDPGSNGYLETNFGNQCGGYFGNTKAFTACQNLIEDVAYCQSRGKKVLISIGGGVSSGRLNSDQDGIDFANQLWQIFGPKACGYTGPRPFGDNVVDGFDLDIEQNGSTGVASLAVTLRNLMDADKNKNYLLTAAPQCVIPDAQIGIALTKARFDFVWVQFYNTAYCSAKSRFDPSLGGDINFGSWASWLKANSPGTPPQILLGLPASNSAAPGYYITPDEVRSLLSTLDSSDLFGGIMLFDAMTSRSNSIGGQDYGSIIHGLLDAEGFARAAAGPNNGYPYSCAGASGAISSTAIVTPIIASSTPVQASSSPTQSAGVPYITSAIATTTSTTTTTSTSTSTSTSSTSSITFSLSGLPYGYPPYAAQASSATINAAAKFAGPAISPSASQPAPYASTATPSSCDNSVSTVTTILTTTAVHTITLYSVSPAPSPNPSLSTTMTSPSPSFSPAPTLSPSASKATSTSTSSQSPSGSTSPGQSTTIIPPYAGGTISTIQTIPTIFTILLSIFAITATYGVLI